MTLTINIASLVKFLVVAILAAFLVGIVLLIISNIRHFLSARRFEASDRQSMRRRWAEIEALLGQPGEMGRKMAVLEADKLLDHALKTLAMPGDNLGERLKFATYKYPRLRDVWWAHRVRNQLAHEASYHLDAALAKKAVKEFKKALETIGAI